MPLGVPVVFTAAVFNLLNDTGVQFQELNQLSPYRNTVYETVSPRVARLGVRILIR